MCECLFLFGYGKVITRDFRGQASITVVEDMRCFSKTLKRLLK